MLPAPVAPQVCYKRSMSDRKYSHRGYMDNQKREGERERSAPGAPRPRPEGPRGRGLGAPSQTAWRCRVCGRKLEVVGRVGFDDTCPGCGGDVHTCSNCAYFDGQAPNECRREVPVRIASKARRNTCELFAPAAAQEFAAEPERAASDPRAAFDALFRKK